MKHKLLIIALLAMVVTGLTWQLSIAQDAQQNKAGEKPALTHREKKELKKAEKKEHKLEKQAKKKEAALSKSNAPTKAEKRKMRRELKRKQKQERKQLKRLQKKEKNKKIGVIVVGPPSPTAPPPPPPPVVRKKQEIVYPRTQMKARYRVDVLAPMYLDDLVKGNAVTYKDRMPDKAVNGITFYEGVSIAADSLKKAGFKIDIYVHDVASAAEATDMLIRKGSLDSADLILGAVQPQDVPMLADYAHRKHVNFVSVLSAVDGGVKENEYYTQILPTLQTHCAFIDSSVARKHPGIKPFLFYRTSTRGDSIAYSYIVNDSPAKLAFRPVLCNSLPHKENMARLFDTVRPNVIVIPILDFVYADSLLKELNHDFPGVHFEVYGMPSWNGIASLKSAIAFPTLVVNITTPFYINANEGVAKYVANTFKKDYGGKATEMAFRGYEAMYWYAHLLKNYGTIFNTRYSDNTAAPFIKFDVKPTWDRNDRVLFNENQHLYLMKYERGLASVVE